MKHLLSSTAFIVLNKQLARRVGLKESILLADLISKEEYFIANGMTDGWFFNTEANIEKDTTLTPYQQRKCLKSLKKEGLIEVKRKGIPAKQYFKINEELVVKFLNNLSLSKCTTINKNKEIRINNKDISIRRLKFINDVSLFDYDKNVLDDFTAYWTEPNKSNTKMRFELQKTWSTNLRLKNWAANQKKWDSPKSKGMSKLDAQINAWQEAKKLI
jgi:DNA-binding PadR family transcriptional regulator